MAAPFTTLEDEVQWAERTVSSARQKLLDLEREGKSYYEGDEDRYSSSLRYALFNARRALTSAERKLVRAQNKLARRKSNPLGRRAQTMTKKRATKKRRSPAQVRATKKLIAFNRKRRTKKKARRKQNPAYGTYQTALAALNPRRRRNPARALRKMNDYGIKGSGKWFDGVGWTKTKANAARWGNLKACEHCAQNVSDRTNKRVSVHTM